MSKENTFQLSNIKNPFTLNLFSDASMRKTNDGTMSGCYGAIAVVDDTIIDSLYRINSSTTVNACEIRGIRNSLRLANKYCKEFSYINIFCDSQVSLLGLRDYFHNWKFDPNSMQLIGTMKQPIANQSVFIECYKLLSILQLTNVVTLYHQSGHVKNGYKAILEAANVFKRSNKIPDTTKIDLNLIRYISTYNNFVDNQTRSILYRTNIYDNEYNDPVSFYWTD